VSDDQAHAILRLIEAQPSIGDRFIDQRRLPGGQPGCFSFVLSATDKFTGGQVALKFYQFGGKGDDDYRRAAFERESRILEALRGQENIVEIICPRSQIHISISDSATGLTVPFPLEFFALEWAPTSVEAVIARGDNDPAQAIRRFRDICKGVQRLHRRRICHRDLKPGNCLILPDGTVVLGDFGTAHDYTDHTPPLSPRYDRPVGDMRYTGLELICGLGDDTSLSFVSDFFSLGAILFELVTLNPLSSYLYAEALDLAQHIWGVPSSTKRTVFDGVVSSFAERWPLPNIQDFPTAVPMVIRDRVNRLYQGLARLDYRSRLKDFDAVFRELEVCSRLLQIEQAYHRWQALKKKRRAARVTKRVVPASDLMIGE
jgi:serine/threonine protein kinase